MSEYLELTFLEEAPKKIVNEFEFRNKPFSISNVFLAPIEHFKLLTKGEDVKRIYDLRLSIKDIPFDFLPGDTIGILPRNNIAEVNKLLIRLNIESYAEKFYRLEISKIKKNFSLKHIPHCGMLKDIFTYYVDIRKPPKKLFLKSIIQYTKDVEEQKQLEEICSPKGSRQYMSLINGSGRSLLGLLNTFLTCFPPIELILEHSLPLQPRYFSISSSPLEKNALHITFFIVENSDGTKGVCTGWLEEVIKRHDTIHIPFYFRKPNNFRIPLDLSVPLIIIATGTGLAPFKSFLDHRLLLKINADCELGDVVLYYGCRYSDRDFLYSTEIVEYLNKGILSKLYTAFSRESVSKCYIQDKINENGEDFVTYVLNKNAIIYVCGNITVVKEVKEVIINNFIQYGNLDRPAAEEYLKELVCNNRFNTDSWL